MCATVSSRTASTHCLNRDRNRRQSRFSPNLLRLVIFNQSGICFSFHRLLNKSRMIYMWVATKAKLFLEDFEDGVRSQIQPSGLGPKPSNK